MANNSSHLDPLPSAELRYALTSESALRFAYGRGIARPNFSDLAPYLVRDDQHQKIDIGNPNLKATHADNIDELYEQYLKPLGMIQGGWFYKHITDPIYSVQSPVTTGAFTGYEQTQPLNGSHAWVWGFEAAFQQRLTYLPGHLSSLGQRDLSDPARILSSDHRRGSALEFSGRDVLTPERRRYTPDRSRGSGRS